MVALHWLVVVDFILRSGFGFEVIRQGKGYQQDT
jgi:hypothetical protein